LSFANAHTHAGAHADPGTKCGSKVESDADPPALRAE
jgi:hypothetical protein